MSAKIKNIAKNTSFFTLALVIQKIITFSYFTILARNLVPDELGKYYLAITFSAIFLIFIDLGQANVLTREVAKNKDEAQKMIRTVMGIKLPLIVISSAIVFALANILRYEEEVKVLIYLSIFLMITDSLSTTFFAVIRGFHNLFYESIISVLTQVVVMGFGLYFLYNHNSLKMLMFAMMAGAGFRFLSSGSLLTLKWKVSLKPNYDIKAIKEFLVLTVPFALFGIFQKLYMYFDTVLLSKLSGDYYTGLYQIAFKIIFALQFLPMAFIASLYPVFSSYYKNKSDQLQISFERGFNYLSIISIPIAVGTIALSDKIIVIFKPEYIEAVPALRITIAALPFLFLNFPIGSLLNACDRQKINTRNMGITLVLSVILNFLLIPKFNAVGASITVFVTNLFMFMLGMFCVPQIIKLRPKKIFLPFIKAFAASLIMGYFVMIFKDQLHIVFNIIVGAFVYFILLFIIRVIRKEDIQSIFSAFIKK